TKYKKYYNTHYSNFIHIIFLTIVRSINIELILPLKKEKAIQKIACPKLTALSYKDTDFYEKTKFIQNTFWNVVVL
ncbi:MAG: hypothetical protein LBP34_07410, partial [Flavobacteriaceae bacterium]|nr:hypothetical protein [Flavobacteriaceae bacterium]